MTVCTRLLKRRTSQRRRADAHVRSGSDLAHAHYRKGPVKIDSEPVLRAANINANVMDARLNTHTGHSNFRWQAAPGALIGLFRDN